MRRVDVSQLIEILQAHEKGRVQIQHFSANKSGNEFELQATLSGTPDLRFDEWNSQQDDVDTLLQTLAENEGKKPVGTQPAKPFEPFEGELCVYPEAFDTSSRQLKARVIDKPSDYPGPARIKLLPDRGYQGMNLVAIASAARLELTVKVSNTREHGSSVFFVKGARIPQPDLFRDELVECVNKIMGADGF